MTGFLIDTNVLSELTKPAPSLKVETFLRDSKDRVFVSVLSIGEIRKGISSLPLSSKRALLEEWLDNEIMPWFGPRALPVSLQISERWGDLSAELRRKGQPRPVIDTLLAATALVHDLTLVTRNTSDYQGLRVSVLNPWE